MDRLWSPWRYSYITKASPADACIFCTKLAENQDRENYIVYRGERNFVLLNLYPYTNGHLMIAPYEHVPTLEQARPDSLVEMIMLAQQAETHLRRLYRPQGLNLGMNIGESAGAGVVGHIHMHMLPRWSGDANFMSVVGETRVLPETLDVTYEKLFAAFTELREKTPPSKT
jgi:ATP adenylyltransferase